METYKTRDEGYKGYYIKSKTIKKNFNKKRKNMATVKEKERKEFEKELFVGLERLQLVGLQPTNSEIEELLGYKPEEEFDYVTESKDGDAQVRIRSIWKGEETGRYFTKVDFLTKKLSKTQEKDGEQKDWWVNQHGEFQAVDDEENLFTNFTHFTTVKWKSEDGKYKTGFGKDDIEEEILGDKKVFRKAIEGEQNFYGWAKKVQPIDFKEHEQSVLFDNKKLFKGGFTDLEERLLSEERKDILALLTVKLDKDGEPHQNIFTKHVLSGGMMTNVKRGMSFTDKYGAKKKWEKFLRDVEFCKDFYGKDNKVKLVHPYNPEDNTAASETTKADEGSAKTPKKKKVLDNSDLDY